MADYDLILAGGGLANGLIALRLADAGLRIAIVEAADRIGGEHTWCFHETDVSPEASRWLAPLVSQAWADQEVRFPAFTRRIPCGYRAITSDQFRAVLAQAPVDLLTARPITAIEPTAVTLADGARLTAKAVIDGRGQRPSRALDIRAQKFVGIEFKTPKPHGVARPIIMDATVDQLDGYRFLYVLPFGPDHLLVEDTRYSDAMALDRGEVRAQALAYAAEKGWEAKEIVREEDGVLPVALGGDIARFWDEQAPAVARSGLAAALFHPVTGYSLPDAVRLAERIAALPGLDPGALYTAARGLSEGLWAERGHFRFLNRMLFEAARPHQRYRVLQRFYRLSDGLVGRFYSATLTAADKIRILTGKPPVPIPAALACLRERPMPAGAA